MPITKGYKVRLYPNREQEARLRHVAGACRWVYNYALESRMKAYVENKRTIPFRDLSRELTRVRGEIEWLSKIPSTPLQQSVRCLDMAYRRFFKKYSRFPNFKSKKDSRQSFRKTNDWSIRGNKISILKDLQIRFRGNFPVRREAMLTVYSDPSGKWYASTTAKIEVEQQPMNSEPIGIDMGLKSLAVTSEGRGCLILDKTSTKRLQQSLSRKKRGSNRYQREKLKLARKHEQTRNRRMNHLHQISHEITSKNHAVIVMEDLAVKNMVQNHKLARSIQNASWGELVRQIQYKQEWRGGQFIKIDRFFPSSKTCSECNFVLDSLPLSVREWDCPRCQTHHDRDVNAAKMILKQGLRNSQASSVQKDSGSPEGITGTMKREDGKPSFRTTTRTNLIPSPAKDNG